MDSPEDVNIKMRQAAPYWWPDANVIMQLFLAAAVVVMVGYILHQLLEGKVSLEQAQRDLLMILFGIILGCFKDVYAYTFGSSAGQKRQGELINKSMETKDKIIADNVTATAAVAAAAAGTGAGTEVPAKIITTAPTDPSVTATTTTVTTAEEPKP